MTGTDDGGEAIDRAFEALERGDLDAARDCFTEDAVVWHGFDRVARGLDETLADWTGLVAAFPERGLEDIRRRTAGDGAFVQQHLFVVRDAAGSRRAWPVCIVVRIEGGRITRLDEYIDRTACYAVGDGPLITPGLPTPPG